MAKSKVDFSFIRKALAFLESKDMHDFPWTSFYPESGANKVLRLETYAGELTQEQYRRIKQIFGPLEIKDDYASGKYAKGSVIFEKWIDTDREQKSWESEADFEKARTQTAFILVKVEGVFSCTKLKGEEIDEEKWDEIKHKVRSGLIEIKDCTHTELNGAAIEDLGDDGVPF